MKNAKTCPRGTFPVNGKCRNVPYSDKVHFYANHKDKTIITAKTKYVGKGWYDVRVGNHFEKTRHGEGSLHWKLMRENYPGHDNEISLFSELSYHSSLGQSKAGKVGNYGTNDYNKDFSVYKKIARYKLLQPVKTQVKTKFGKEIDKVTVHQWRYIVIDWIPKGRDKPVTLQIKDTVHNPLTDKEETLFKSKEIPLSKKQEAFKLFNKRVADAKRWK